jgi:transmembrane sensor
MSSTNHDIDSVAADWAARRDLGGLSAREQAAFDTWLHADVRHLGAYGRAEAVLCRVERLNALARKPGRYDGPGQPAWNRRRVLLAGGGAAAAGVTVAAGLSWPRRGADEETIATQIGQMREVVLPDGSIMSVNTNSAISVRFTNDARNIDLLKGEALFDVVKDKSRPFVVSAGDTSVRAVGTSFTVSRLPRQPIQVLVKEGVVELQRPGVPEAMPVRASANVQAIASPGAPIVTVAMPQEQLVRDLEWRHGRIALDNETLADAAAEFARYSEVHIVVDPAVSDRTVTGLFASNDPVGFAKAAVSVLKLQMEVKGNEVIIFNG